MSKDVRSQILWTKLHITQTSLTPLNHITTTTNGLTTKADKYDYDCYDSPPPQSPSEENMMTATYYVC